MKKFYVGIVLISLLAIASCGGSSSSSDGGGTTAETVTISGTLSTTTNADISAAKASGSPLKTAVAAGYILQCIDLTKNSQDYITTDAGGAFSFTVVGGDSVACNVLNGEYGMEGLLAFASEDTRATMGLSTASAGQTIDWGNVTLNTDTNTATPGNDVSDHANAQYICTAVNGTLLGAPTFGALTTGIDNETGGDRTSNSDGTVDLDGDCVRDVLGDVDDDNDGIGDDQAGVKYSGCPGIEFITLFINNQRQVSDPDAAPDYMLTQHLVPSDGHTISSVSVSGPPYLDDLSIVNSEYYDTPITADTPWDKTLVPCTNTGSETMANHCIFLQTSPTATTNLSDRIAQGDQFVYDVAFTDGTNVTCTRTINSVIDKVLKNVRVCDDDVSAANCTTSFTGGWIALSNVDANANNMFKFVYEIPAGMQLGFTHRFDIATYEVGCNPGTMSLPDMVDIDSSFLGDQRTAATEAQANTEVIVNWTNANWPTSPINAWNITLTAYDVMGDNSKLAGFGAYTGGTNPCQ